jgi:glutathione S-transferase
MSEYQLVYWPHIPGRGEFVRLILEACEVHYDDVARRPVGEGGGPEAVLRLMRDRAIFAPPALLRGDSVWFQTVSICAYLGRRLGLAPDDELGRLRARELMSTVVDVVDEFHALHHPISVRLTYEEQAAEARRAAKVFREHRLRERLDFFEQVLARSESGYFVGPSMTYVDLAAFQLLRGAAYALPRSFDRERPRIPRLLALEARVADHPHLGPYLASERRLPFTSEGIFRYYPELDEA